MYKFEISFKHNKGLYTKPNFYKDYINKITLKALVN